MISLRPLLCTSPGHDSSILSPSPEFSPTEPPDHHHKYIQPLSPAHPPSRPSATLLDYRPPYSSHDPKLPLTSHTDMSATRYVGQASKRSPQPKAEVSSSSVSKGSSRGNDTGMSSLEQNRNDHIRGNQGAGLSDSTSGGGAEKKKAPSAKPARKANEKDSGSWNADGKSRSRDTGMTKLSSPTATIHPPVVATRGVSSNSFASSTHSKADTTANDGKTTQSHSTRGKAPSRQSTKGHRSNQTPARDPSPSSSSVGSSANEYNYSSSASTKDSSWSKTIYSTDKHHGSTISPTSTLPGSSSLTNQKPLYEDKDEFMWSTSQESNSADWGAEVDLEEQLLWSSSTDDDKINYSE